MYRSWPEYRAWRQFVKLVPGECFADGCCPELKSISSSLFTAKCPETRLCNVVWGKIRAEIEWKASHHMHNSWLSLSSACRLTDECTHRKHIVNTYSQIQTGKKKGEKKTYVHRPLCVLIIRPFWSFIPVLNSGQFSQHGSYLGIITQQQHHSKTWEVLLPCKQGRKNNKHGYLENQNLNQSSKLYLFSLKRNLMHLYGWSYWATLMKKCVCVCVCV